jgi:hypothetical protein
MWTVTGIDYEAPLFANAEAREGAGVAPMLWAKWIQRGLATPSRTVKGGRAGQYAAKKIFELRAMNVIAQQTAIPVSEAQQIAALAAKGPWDPTELKKGNNWRRYVIRDDAAPLDIRLLFSRSDDCWGYEADLGDHPKFKQSAILVLTAGRELITVSKYCWGLLNEAGRPSGTIQKAR